jgi:protein-disulfide isomerase
VDKVKAPTSEELSAFYKENAHMIQVDFETAKPHIQREMLKQRRSELEMAFLTGLRAQNTVKYDLPVPELPRQAMPKAPAPFTGPQDAKVVLVEFGDFECPYCAQAHRLVKELRQLYPNQLRVEYRHFPLEQHTRAKPAAIASECANQQGMFWEYHDYLYENPRALQDSDLSNYAKNAKLDMEKFKTCLTSNRAAKVVMRDTEIAQKLGVDGTPSIYINGIKLIGLLPLPLIRVIIDHELK